MPFSPVVLDRERDKFVENPSGETSVRVYVGNETGQEIPVTATFSGSVAAAAPTGPLKRLVTTVTDVAADPILVPLANRVSLVVRNKSLTNTIYLGEDNTITPDDTATGGWEIGPGEDFSLDLSEDNVFFLIAPAGQSAVVKILEIASAASSGGGGGLPGVMTQEVPSGLINGVNTTYTITTTPLGAGYFTLYLNGQYQRPGVDYTRVGTTITMAVAPTDTPPETLDAVYWY